MTILYRMTGNPVMSPAEARAVIPAVWQTKEAMVLYEQESRIPGGEKLDGCYFTYAADSLLRYFNGSSVGDYHPPESSFGGFVVNLCVKDIQFHELNVHDDWREFMKEQGLAIDPVYTKQAALC